MRCCLCVFTSGRSVRVAFLPCAGNSIYFAKTHLKKFTRLFLGKQENKKYSVQDIFKIL